MTEIQIEGRLSRRGQASFCACVGAAALAWFIGKALNVPIWRDWDMGDRVDLAVIAFFTMRWALRAVRPAAPSKLPGQEKGEGDGPRS